MNVHGQRISLCYREPTEEERGTVDTAQIESQVRSILAGLSHGREVPDHDAALAEVGFDSLTKVEVIVQVERTFGIQFGEADISGANFATLGAIVRLVESRLA
jgi:acyl carrier protein